MKIAALSDIHGNKYALKEVLDELSHHQIEKVFVLGDSVGYYYYPGEVLEMLSPWEPEMIQGNHEKLLMQLRNKEIDSAALKSKYGSGHDIALEKLSKKQLEYLFSKPFSSSVKIDDISFQLNHGSPWDYNTYLYPDTDKTILEKCNSSDHDFVLVGHSHYAFTYTCSNSILVNVGSVGQSRSKGGIADWVIIETSTKQVEFKETAYSTECLMRDVEKFDPENSYNLSILNR